MLFCIALVAVPAGSPCMGASSQYPETVREAEDDEREASNPDSKGDADSAIPGLLEELSDRVSIGGSIEVEAFYERVSPADESDQETSDIDLTTVDLYVEADLFLDLTGFVQISYENDAGIIIADEAMVHFRADGPGEPAADRPTLVYGSFGKMTIPFGDFEGRFISDSPTLTLGEAIETALVPGLNVPPFNVVAGFYQGDVDEDGRDVAVPNAFGMLTVSPPLESLDLTAGVSYINSIADSDELTDYIRTEFESSTVDDFVAGLGLVLSAAWTERWFLDAVYLGALDSFDEDEDFAPKAWSVELACRLIDPLEIAVRYGGSQDALDFLPETQTGIVAIFDLLDTPFWLDDTSLSLEYQYEKYEDGETADTITTQLTIDF